MFSPAPLLGRPGTEEGRRRDPPLLRSEGPELRERQVWQQVPQPLDGTEGAQGWARASVGPSPLHPCAESRRWLLLRVRACVPSSCPEQVRP